MLKRFRIPAAFTVTASDEEEARAIVLMRLTLCEVVDCPEITAAEVDGLAVEKMPSLY